MAKAEFFVVYIQRLPEVSYEAVEAKMNLCKSWYRLDEKMWIIYTTSDLDKLNNRFAPLAKTAGNFLVCRLDVTQRKGWMNKKFWAWLKEWQAK